MSKTAAVLVIGGLFLVIWMALLHLGLPSWESRAQRLTRWVAGVGALMSVAGFLLLV